VAQAAEAGDDSVPGPYALERLYLACAFAAIVYGPFFMTLLSIPLYRGRTFERWLGHGQKREAVGPIVVVAREPQNFAAALWICMR
jgi:hypothetical protein